MNVHGRGTLQLVLYNSGYGKSQKSLCFTTCEVFGDSPLKWSCLEELWRVSDSTASLHTCVNKACDVLLPVRTSGGVVGSLAILNKCHYPPLSTKLNRSFIHIPLKSVTYGRFNF